MKGLALAFIVPAGMAMATSGCDRQAAPAEAGAASVAPRPATDGTPGRDGDREQLKVELRKEIEADLRAELTRELRPKIRAEIERELAGHPSEGPAPTEPSHLAERPDAGTAGDPAVPIHPAGPTPGLPGDPWNTPGAKIWPASPGGFRLIDVEVGTGLEEKVPTDVRAEYDTVPELLYCYTVFENPGPEVTVTHVWRRGTRLVSRVELEVGASPKWKTWSKQRTQANWTGLWSCEVLGPEGEQLGLTVFRIGTGMP